MRPENINAKTNELVDAFNRAVAGLDKARNEVQSREVDLLDAKNALGKWFCPDDAKVGETFSIWYGDGMISVTLKQQLGDNCDFEIFWRKHPSPRK